jgi:polar amino acid transport system substrate-binding protein
MRSLKYLLVVFTMYLCALVPANVLCTDEILKIRVGVSADLPPFESVDSATGKIIGFDIDLMNAIAKKSGFEVEYVNMLWDDIFAGLDSNRYDAIISAVTITDKREEAYDLSDPYITVTVSNSEFNPDNIEDYGIVVRKGNQKVLDLINKGLNEVIRENLIEELRVKWEIQ